MNKLINATGVGLKLKYLVGLTIIALVLLVQCESNERFYRPNLPEKLTSLGIIDIDDTVLRHISFEKSFQREYSDDLKDSLREFSFSISSSRGELFSYHNDKTIKELKDFKIPTNISFSPGEKYILTAKEKYIPEFSAESLAPYPPAKPSLESIKKEVIEISGSSNCRGFTEAKYALIKISFENDLKTGSYYGLMLEATGWVEGWLSEPEKILIEYDVKASNTPVFFAIIYGLTTGYWNCGGEGATITPQIRVLFFDGSRIPDNKCVITLATKFHDGYALIDIIKSFRIKLISIPEQLFFFEKSLYTYRNDKGNPFVEPIYLGGNIRGGFGVFALCRSADLFIDLPTPY
jgi:hypothetical protein